jgi:transposase-like protein
VGRPIGPKKVHRYSVEFKLTAVKLSGMTGVQVQTVANALDIQMVLSWWRRQRSPSGHRPQTLMEARADIGR